MKKIIYIAGFILILILIGSSIVYYSVNKKYTFCNNDSECILIPENGLSACSGKYEGVAINKDQRGAWIDAKFSDLKGTKCMYPSKFHFFNKKAVCKNNICKKIKSETN